jgi:uncharacterized membrane protein
MNNLFLSEAERIIQVSEDQMWNVLMSPTSLRFLTRVRSIDPIGQNLYNWTLNGPLGIPISWQAVIEKPATGKGWVWRSVNSPFRGNGHLLLSPQDQATLVSLSLSYYPLAGAMGDFVENMFAKGNYMAEQDLETLVRQIKQKSREYNPHNAQNSSYS